MVGVIRYVELFSGLFGLGGHVGEDAEAGVEELRGLLVFVGLVELADAGDLGDGLEAESVA